MARVDNMQARLLDAVGAHRESRRMSRILPLALAAAAALAGCNQESHTIGGNNEADANAVNTANVELPPSIVASKKYRCHDNSLISVDWLSDNKSANVRVGEEPAATHFAAETAGEALKSPDGKSLTGTATASSVTYGGQTCKA
jgi:hypothetical protein